MQEKERRCFERIEDFVSVRYRTIGGKIEDASSVKDVGGGGIRLSLPERLNPGTTVDLEITIPDISKPFPAVGEVIWIREVGISGDSVARYFDTGIKFIKIDPICLGRVYTYFHQQK